jgi:5-methylcytosine-specific restriction endonuclease McrA
MVNHKKVYIDFFKYTSADFVPCTMCLKEATDIHHIDPRMMGGVKDNRLDTIENLVALCRKCHNKAEDDDEFNEIVRRKHLKRIKLRMQSYMFKKKL